MTHEEIEAITALDALGAASADEQRTMNAHLGDCQACRHARDEYAEAAAQLVYQLEPVEPPADVRERVVSALRRGGVAEFRGPAHPETARPRNRATSVWWLATAATLFLALWGWREIGIRVAREHIVAQQAEIRRLSEERDRLAAQNEKLASLASPDTRTIALTGQEMSPTASARVFLDPAKRRAIVFFHNLPSNPNDKSYQLWIIRGDQPNPQSAGVFDVGGSGNATLSIENLPVMTEIKALAVTMERRGGADQPSEKKFYVLGGMS
jgi:anti-sigma-K factor RskA